MITDFNITLLSFARPERYLATIAVQEDAINSLHEECNSLRPQISIAGKKVAQLEHMLQVGGARTALWRIVSS